MKIKENNPNNKNYAHTHTHNTPVKESCTDFVKNTLLKLKSSQFMINDRKTR